MRGSIQRRGKGLWRLVFDLPRDHTGRRSQKAVTFEGAKKDAEVELARLISELKNGGFVDPKNLTLGGYLETWLKDDVKNSVSPKTLERYSEICLKSIIPEIGVIRLSDLSSIAIQQYYTKLQASGRKDGKGGLSARTALHHHRVLKSALKRAVMHKPPLIRWNPADGVKPPRPERKDINVVDEASTARLLRAVEGMTVYVPILLAITTGLRRGEILALRWASVDLNAGTISVTHSLEETKDGLRFKPPKTRSGRREVTLPSFTIQALRAHKAEQAETRLKLGLGKDENDLVCPRYDGCARSPRAFTKEFKRLAVKAGMPDITFHGLRHSHATQLLKSGIHPKVAQERLGHSTIATTMDLYSHVTKSMQEDAAACVDDALRAALSKPNENEN